MMSAEERERKQEVLDALKRRLHEREVQAAKYGVSADPIIQIEIDDLRKEITQLQRDLTGHSKVNLFTSNSTETVTSETKLHPNYIQLGIFCILLLGVVSLIIMLRSNSEQASGSQQPIPSEPASVSTAAPLEATPFSHATSAVEPPVEPTVPVIETLLVGSAEDRYVIKITAYNPTSQDILAKHIDVEHSSTYNSEIIGCAPPTYTFSFSDTIRITGDQGDKLRFTVDMSSDDLSGYIFLAVGSFWANPCYVSLTYEFDTSLILPKNEYTSFAIVVPKKFTVTEAHTESGSVPTPKGLPSSINIPLDKPDDPSEYKKYELAVRIRTNYKEKDNMYYSTDLLNNSTH
jgi:hypothetical protein